MPIDSTLLTTSPYFGGLDLLILGYLLLLAILTAPYSSPSCSARSEQQAHSIQQFLGSSRQI